MCVVVISCVVVWFLVCVGLLLYPPTVLVRVVIKCSRACCLWFVVCCCVLACLCVFVLLCVLLACVVCAVCDLLCEVVWCVCLFRGCVYACV